MIVGWLSVEDFRNHRSTCVCFDPDRTLVLGPNGHGKTNLLEAIDLLSGTRSFRGAASETLVRAGCVRAIVRAEIVRRGRTHVVEMEIAAAGRSRAQVNRNPVRPLRNLADVVSTVVFCPTDLALPSGPPAVRREFLDEVLGRTDPEFRAVRADFERILRQRNNLLKQTGRRPDDEALATLDVWDTQFAAAGEIVADRRIALCAALAPSVQHAYTELAGVETPVHLSYSAPWRASNLAETLSSGRSDDLRRGATLAGPHRDDLVISVDGLPARTHASQGEQRSIALSLRLAQHGYTAATMGDPPVVLLDDVFSELDDGRARRLVDCLPGAQTILTSAQGNVPHGIEFAGRVHVRDGKATTAP